MVRNHLLMYDGFPIFYPHETKSREMQFNSYLSVMCWKVTLVWQNSMNESGDVLLENVLFEKE